MIHKKKRIAVALSPEAINTVALREKSIRHGIQTSHGVLRIQENEEPLCVLAMTRKSMP